MAYPLVLLQMKTCQEPFRGAGRAGSFSPPRLLTPPLTVHRTSHHNRPRRRENVECASRLEQILLLDFPRCSDWRHSTYHRRAKGIHDYY
jgi:hypothetical protein